MEAFFQKLDDISQKLGQNQPDPVDVRQLTKLLHGFLFPLPARGEGNSESRFIALRAKLADVLRPLSEEEKAAERKAEAFLAALPAIHEMLLEDAAFFLENDPAATSLAEIIGCYPGFFAIAQHRMAHEFHRLGVPLLPRFLSEISHSRTGVDIHPAARIGRSFFIDHGTGIVVGATASIGDRVKIYQGVTLGALQVSRSIAAAKRHPTVEDDVTIYANATILGGRTTVGHDCVIGSGAWVAQSVAPHSTVMHRAEQKVRSRLAAEPLNFVI